MPYEMAMRDEISRIQFYQRVQELVARVEAQPEQQAEPVKPAGQLQECIYGRGQVLWFAKPADRSMLYTTPPAAQRKPLTATTIGNMMPSTIKSWQANNHKR